MHHLLRSQPLIAEYGARSKGIRPAQWDLPWDDFVSIKARLPSVDSQKAIADYLDTETDRIDALISKRGRMIQLLTERWVAQIVEMTGGTGRCWNKVPLGRLIDSVVGGSWGNPVGRGDVDAYCVRGTDFDTETLLVNKDSTPRRSFDYEEFRQRRLLPTDIVIEKSGGGDKQPVGRIAQWPGRAAAVPTNFAARLRPATEVDGRYLAFLFRAAYESGRTRGWIKQTTGIQNLDLGGFLSEKHPIPPINDQCKVAEFLDSATSHLKYVKERLQEQISLLTERRQALITAAVTGELAVPGVAA